MEVIEKWQALTDELIAATVEVLKSGVVPPANLFYSDPKIIGILLMARTVSHAKGVRELVKKRRILEARILTRNCLENCFWIGGLIDQGKTFVDEMIQDEQKRRVSRGQLLFENQMIFDADAAKKLRDWMKDRKHWKDSKTLNPKVVADGTSFDGAYIFYAELSVDAHPGLEALRRYLASNDDDAEILLEPGINLSEVLDTLHILAFALLTTVVGVDQLLGHGAGELMTKLTAEFQELEKAL